MLSLYKFLPLTSDTSEPPPILDLLSGSDDLKISRQEQGGWRVGVSSQAGPWGTALEGQLQQLFGRQGCRGG